MRLLLAALLLALASPATAQPRATGAQDFARWAQPAEPFRIAGPLYYVGTKGLGAYLIETPVGLLLLNSGTQVSGPMIACAIEALGFKLADLRFLLVSHAHFDHVGGHAWLRKSSGAEVVALDVEAPLLASGGRADFAYSNLPAFRFARVRASRLLQDGEALDFGGVRLVPHHTPGHTRGTTTWTMTIRDGTRELQIAFPDGTSVNPGYRLGADPSYPGIGEDYARTFARLEKLAPDIWLTSHPENSDLWARKARAEKDGIGAWIDREGYRAWIAERKAEFERKRAEAGKVQ